MTQLQLAHLSIGLMALSGALSQMHYVDAALIVATGAAAAIAVAWRRELATEGW